MKAREQGLLITLILAAGVAAWALEIPRWRLVTMPDGSSRLITWPERPARDAVYQAEVGRAIVRKDLEADDWKCYARPKNAASSLRHFIVCKDGVVRAAPAGEVADCSSTPVN